MDLSALLILVNILVFAGTAYYFAVQKKQLEEAEKTWIDKRKLLDQEIIISKEELEKKAEDITQQSNYILTESESIANEIIEYLQSLLGENSENKIILPSADNYEVKLEQLKQTIKKQYETRIEKLLKRFEDYKVRQAVKIEGYAQERMEEGDKSFQEFRIEQLKKMELRLESYKNAEIALFEEKVRKVVDQAAMDLLGHLLTREEHEELIAKALMKAKVNNGL